MITEESTIAEMHIAFASTRVMRIQLTLVPTVVVLVVKDDGSTAMSAGHGTISAAVADVLARMKTS